METSRKSRIQK